VAKETVTASWSQAHLNLGTKRPKAVITQPLALSLSRGLNDSQSILQQASETVCNTSGVVLLFSASRVGSLIWDVKGTTLLFAVAP